MPIRLTHVSLASTLCLLAATSHAVDVVYQDDPARTFVYVSKSNSLTDSYAPVSSPATVAAQINGADTSVAQTGFVFLSQPPAFGVPEQQANITGNGQLRLASGDVDYQFGGQAWGNALYGRMSAQAQGHVQSLLTPTPPYPYEAVYTTGSAGVSTVNDFFLMAPISPGDASPPGVGPQILTLSMTVTGHTIADPAGATSPYANFKLSLSNDPTRSSPTAVTLEQSWNVTDVGDWGRTFSLDYEITTANGLECLNPILSPYVGCSFYIGSQADVSVASGSGAKQLINVDVSLAWSLSEPSAWKSISTSTRHWGEPLPAVPEPSQGVMALFGAVVVGAAVRSRRRASREA